MKMSETPPARAEKRDGAPVGRPAGAEDLAQLGERDLALDPVLRDVDDRQERPALGDGAEDEHLALGVPGPRRADELEALEMGVDGGRDDLPLDLPRHGVGQVEIDGEQVPRGQEDHLLPVGAQGRRDVVDVLFGPQDDGLSGLIGHQGFIIEGRVGVLHRLVPVGGDLFQLAPQADLENGLVAPLAAHVLHHLADDLVAQPAGDIGPEGVAVSIREVLRVLELADLGQVLAADRVPHPHGGVGVDGPDGQVLGHALDEPEGDPQGVLGAPLVVRMALGHDVVLERVDELMPDDMVGLGERGPVGQDDPALEGFGDAAGALAHRSGNDRGLLELRAARVQDQRLASLELMVEHPGKPGVPALGHQARLLDRFPVLEIEVDVEMPGLHDLEVELLVLDLVPAVVLGRERRGQGRRSP